MRRQAKARIVMGVVAVLLVAPAEAGAGGCAGPDFTGLVVCTFNGDSGTLGAAGGGGGGFSAIVAGTTPLVVAAGGGGAANGAVGGDAGSGGASGADQPGIGGAVGGGSGTSGGAAGAGGTPSATCGSPTHGLNGSAGSATSGGAGGIAAFGFLDSGGGGGGGYPLSGGGGGGAGLCGGTPGTAAGGGGGASFIAASGSNQSVGLSSSTNGDVTFSYVIDTVAPHTSIMTSPPPLSATSSVSVSFTGSDDRTPTPQLRFVCSLDGAAFTPCASPSTYNNLADGTHTFRVAARGAAANIDPTPASATFLIAARAPTLALPQPIVVEAASPAGALVTYSAGAIDAAGAFVICRPASGMIFPPGRSMVGCSASDPVGHTATGSFTVAVGFRLDRLHEPRRGTRFRSGAIHLSFALTALNGTLPTAVARRLHPVAALTVATRRHSRTLVHDHCAIHQRIRRSPVSSSCRANATSPRPCSPSHLAPFHCSATPCRNRYASASARSKVIRRRSCRVSHTRTA